MSKRNAILSILLFSICGHAELVFKPYGWVKLGLEWNEKNTGSFPDPDIRAFPLNDIGQTQHNEVIIDARHSRIGFTATEEWKGIKFFGQNEWDFYTSDGSARTTNGRHLRLRKIYARAELPSGLFFLAGQFYSLMRNLDVADILQYLINEEAPVGSTNARQPQIRLGYVHDFCDFGVVKIEADLEKTSLNSLGYVDLISASQVDTAEGSGQKMPLAVGKLSWYYKKFKTETSAAGTRAYVTPYLAPSTKGLELSTGIWGIQHASEIKIKSLNLGYRMYYVHGLGRLVRPRYFDCVLLGNHLEAVNEYGGVIEAHYEWDDSLWFNGVAGWANIQEIPGSENSGRAIHIARSITANVLYNFWTRWRVGVEYCYVGLQSFSGIPGKVSIVNSALYFYF